MEKQKVRLWGPQETKAYLVATAANRAIADAGAAARPHVILLTGPTAAPYRMVLIIAETRAFRIIKWTA